MHLCQSAVGLSLARAGADDIDDYCECHAIRVSYILDVLNEAEEKPNV
jgi:hypothetical protein